MTRNDAIAIIRKEILCIERDCDIERSCGKCDLMMPSKEPILEAYRMAMVYLEALDDIKAEIDNQHKWLMQTKHTLCDIDIAFDKIKSVTDKYMRGTENE